VKRWLRGSEAGEPPAAEFRAGLEVPGIAIADRPGTETVRVSRRPANSPAPVAANFDAVLHLDCTTGTLADMAGDLAVQGSVTTSMRLPVVKTSQGSPS
jgi:hypothetical protein